MAKIAEKKAHLNYGEKLKIMATFVRREVKMWARFRVSFFMDLVGILAQASIFLFIGTAFMKDSAAMAQYGGDYVTYLILGLAFIKFMDNSLVSPYGSLSESYWMSRLETILLSPSSVSLMIASKTVWGYVKTLLDIVIYFLLG